MQQISVQARSLGLDFLATTDHNTAAAHQPWLDHADDSELLVILGEEVTTQDGHWLALGIANGQVIDWRYEAADDVIDRHLDHVHQSGGICIVAHPHAPYQSGTFRYPYDGFDAVEVWNGAWTSTMPWQADNEAALLHWVGRLNAVVPGGRWQPMIGNSDTHLDGQIGAPHTVVASERLDVEAIMTGIRTGRCWIAAEPTVDISFTASTRGRSAGIGDRLDTGDSPFLVSAKVAGVPSGFVRLYTEQGETRSATMPSSGVGQLEWTVSEPAAFVRLEVRTFGGDMAALTNPIFLA